MNIHAVDPYGQYQRFTAIPVEEEPTNGVTENQTELPAPTAVPDDQSSEVTPAGDVGGEENESARGVLRLLQEGHFRGVADVRLRINFYDEIAAMERDAVNGAARAGAETITGVVGSQVDALLANGTVEEPIAAGIRDSMATFGAGVSASLDDFQSQGDVSAEDLIGRIRSDFDAFLVAMKSTLEPAAPPETGDSGPDAMAQPVEEIALTLASAEAGGEVPSPSNTDDIPATDFEDFFTSLIDAFETELQKLETSLSDVHVLPELSAPQGNGKAYEKFLAIYNDLRGQTGAEAPAPIVDATA